MSRYTFQSQPSQCQQSVCSRQTSPPRLLIRLHFKIRRQPRGETDYSQHERPGKKGAELVGISSHVIYCITIISLTMGASYNTSDVSYCIAWPSTWHCTMTVFYQTLHVISGTWVSYSGEITSHLTLSTTMTIATHHHTG